MKYLSPDDIAAMLNLNRRYVVDRLTKDPAWPRPVLKTKRYLRWAESEVQKWLGDRRAD